MLFFSNCKYNYKEFPGFFVGNYVDFLNNNKATDCAYVFFEDGNMLYYNNHDTKITLL